MLFILLEKREGQDKLEEFTFNQLSCPANMVIIRLFTIDCLCGANKKIQFMQPKNISEKVSKFFVGILKSIIVNETDQCGSYNLLLLLLLQPK